MQHTTNSKDDVSEFGRMVEFRSPADPVWGCKPEVLVQRHRIHTLRSIALVAAEQGKSGLTIVLTP